MSFLSRYSGVLDELLSACQIRSGGNELLSVQLEPDDLPTLRFLSVPTESEEPTLCKLLFSSSGPQRAAQGCTPGTRWASPHHPVIVKVSGEGFDVEHRHLQSYWPLMLYDICNFITKCRKGGMRELLIECDARTAQLLLCAEMSTEAKDLTVVEAFSASVFAFTCLIRLTGISQMQVAPQISNGFLHIRMVEPSDQHSAEMRVCIYRPDDAQFVEKFQGCLTSSSSDVLMCILFNEIDTCEWYLTVKGVEGQRYRLPSHDTTRLQMMSLATRLTIQVTTFDFQQGNCYRTTGELTADETLAEFKDDEFLQTIIPVCRQAAQQRSFRLECFTVPCRTTLHLMRLFTEGENRNRADIGSKVHGGPPSEVSPATIFRSAASGDAAGVLQMVEANQSMVHCPNEQLPHRTALLCAASASLVNYSQGGRFHTECSRLLINKGANVLVTDSQRRTVLHCAVLSANPELVKLLLETTAVDVNCTDEDNATPLLQAVIQEDLQITRLLLEYGADCRARDSKGRTALTVALTSGSSDIVGILTDHFPDLLLEERYQEFASNYSLALNAGHKDVCASLIARKYGFTEDCIKEAVKLSSLICLGKYEELHNMLTTQNCNYRDWKLKTPLMWASIGSRKPNENHSKCANLLLQLRAEHAAMDLEGNTPLHLAAATGNTSVARSLLRSGASMSVKNFLGATPEMVAKERGHEDVLNVFTEETDECLPSGAANLRTLIEEYLSLLKTTPRWHVDNQSQLEATRLSAQRLLDTVALIRSQTDQQFESQVSSIEVSEGQRKASSDSGVMSNNIDKIENTIDSDEIVKMRCQSGFFDCKNIGDYSILDLWQHSSDDADERNCCGHDFITSEASDPAAGEYKKANWPQEYRRKLPSQRCCAEFQFQTGCSVELPPAIATH